MFARVAKMMGQKVGGQERLSCNFNLETVVLLQISHNPYPRFANK